MKETVTPCGDSCNYCPRFNENDKIKLCAIAENCGINADFAVKCRLLKK